MLIIMRLRLRREKILHAIVSGSRKMVPLIANQSHRRRRACCEHGAAAEVDTVGVFLGAAAEVCTVGVVRLRFQKDQAWSGNLMSGVCSIVAHAF